MKAWKILGKVIPALNIADRAAQKYLELSDSDFSKMSTFPVLKSLLKTGGVQVSSEAPSNTLNDVSKLQEKVSDLLRGKTSLETELEKAKLSVSDLRKKAIAEIEEKDAEIAKLKAALEAAKK